MIFQKQYVCINYYDQILGLRQAYTANPEYLSLVEVAVEVVCIGNTIGVLTPFGIVDTSYVWPLRLLRALSDANKELT